MDDAAQPFIVDLEPGKKAVCACGRSRSRPWCDGSHAGTGTVPYVVVIEKARRVALCGCGRSAKPPYCDGSHNR